MELKLHDVAYCSGDSIREKQKWTVRGANGDGMDSGFHGSILMSKKRDRNVSATTEALRSDKLRGMIHLSRRVSNRIDQGLKA
jgi:hypothetical protein